MPYAAKTFAAWNSSEHSWVIGEVVSYDAKSKSYTCTSTDPEPQTQSRIPDNEENIYACQPEVMEEDVNDLLELTELHESTLLFCLKRRYLKDVVYTNIGPIVVALNPFNYNIPNYMDSKMPDYLSEGVVIERNLPHSWAVAHNTYWELRENSQDQTILISGESGAGKTEGAKIVVKYLGAISTLKGTAEQKEACNNVNKKIIAASPILESFGNAKTVRNDNSSRFGKFMKLQFDKDGFLLGANAIKYLLEKSRIVTASKEERVYHSFYQLVQGSDKAKYGLKDAGVYKSLTAGECITIPKVDDAQDHTICKAAMTEVGISADQQDAIWRCVAGILSIQNVDFGEREDKSMKAAFVDSVYTPVLDHACTLWGIVTPEMEKELTSTTTVTRGEVVVKPLDRMKAMDCRDSICKSLYDALFDWLVVKINITTDNHEKCVNWVGLLDIFGFEDFQYNSFEQVCINLANESLQNHYNNYIFLEDMKECREEGIDVSSVTFCDNKVCLELLMGKTGIFSLLDEECKVNGTEKNFLERINTQFASGKEKTGNPFFIAVQGKKKDNHFGIRHYAGDVVYCVDGFLDKNRDTLKDSIRTLFNKVADPLISKLIAPPVDDSQRAVRLTVGGFFKNQLVELMTLIQGTNPHWIRCIKPHPAKQPRMFSHKSVINQLRSAGVLDTVKVRKAGFPIRFKHELFVKRYGLLMGLFPSDPPTNVANCNKLFSKLQIEPNIGQLGKTKVFLRNAAFVKFNRAKEIVIMELASRFQRFGRAYVGRQDSFRLYCLKHREKILEERRIKAEAERQRLEAERQRQLKEEAERRAKEEAKIRAIMKAVVTCQRIVRGWMARLRFFRNTLEELRAKEEYRSDEQQAKARRVIEELDKRRKWLEERELDKEAAKATHHATSHQAKKEAERARRLKVADERSHRVEERERKVEEQRQRMIHMEMEMLKTKRDKERRDKEEKLRKLQEEKVKKMAVQVEAREKRMALQRAEYEATQRRERHKESLMEAAESKFISKIQTRDQQRHKRSVFDNVVNAYVEREEWELMRDHVLEADMEFANENQFHHRGSHPLHHDPSRLFVPAVLPYSVASLNNTVTATTLSGKQRRLEREYQDRIDNELARRDQQEEEWRRFYMGS